ncbi:MAG: hypothetical protein J6S82_04100 [Bacteroidales bacterium]|nr:hypothetical protein [Bacteroidales bacterium]
MDNNVYYNEQQQTIGHGANNIKTWSALVNNDFNSKYEKVAFIDAAAMNFHTGGAKGVIPIDPAVKTDLEGKPRAGYTNAGCYHDFIPTNYDASLLEITHPENGAVTGSTDSVLVTIQNMGKADLASVTVQWKLNGVLQQPYKWVAATGKELDMGSPFDWFGEESHPDYVVESRMSNLESSEWRANRQILWDAMLGHGFTMIDSEWWHFTLANEPYPDTYFDFPVKP